MSEMDEMARVILYQLMWDIIRQLMLHGLYTNNLGDCRSWIVTRSIKGITNVYFVDFHSLISMSDGQRKRRTRWRDSSKNLHQRATD